MSVPKFHSSGFKLVCAAIESNIRQIQQLSLVGVPTSYAVDALAACLDNEGNSLTPEQQVAVIKALEKGFPEMPKQLSVDTEESFTATVRGMQGDPETQKVALAVAQVLNLKIEEDDEKEPEISKYEKMNCVELGEALLEAARKGDLEAIEQIKQRPYFKNPCNKNIDVREASNIKDPWARDVAYAVRMVLVSADFLPEDRQVEVIKLLETFPEHFQADLELQLQIQEKLESFEEGCGKRVKQAMRSFFEEDLDDINDRLARLMQE